MVIVIVGVLAAGARAETGGRGDSIAGQLLVASETMEDPRFAETIVYMIAHDVSGAMGLIVNVPLALVPIATLLDRFGHDAADASGEVPVHYGGPVDPGRGFFLHTTDVMRPDSARVRGEIAVTGDPEILRALGAGEGPAHGLFALGYAGWGPGQLEGELARAAWFVLPSDMALLFAERPAESWRRALSLRGVAL